MTAPAVRFEGQAILAPLTRLGNLPFRRLCRELGADVTVGEMAMARKLLEGRRGELALLRRHPSEAVFGVQLCGDQARELAEASRLAVDHGADFVDLNLGCPIDAVTRHGGGAALLRKPARVASLVRAMVAAVEVPVTLKVRLGWQDDRPTAVEVARLAAAEGAAAVAVHGRSRAQRYRRPADWDAIAEVAAAVDVPVIGNGDLFHHHELAARLDGTGIAAGMIARGALVKPWIFREIREGRVLDPSSEQRLGWLRTWASHAREHFGDDEHGQRRIWGFFLHHMDFLRRYVPVGALAADHARAGGEGPPPVQGVQAREPAFTPRDELEALMASADPDDHDRLGELVIGPRPDGLKDLPRPRVTG